MRGLRRICNLFAIAFLILSGMLLGCSKKAEQSAEEAEAVAAQMTAAQMEAAKEGRSAARAIITKEWRDTMRLQEAILEARAVSSKYEMQGNMKCKQTFDTAFFNTIRTVRPELADELQPKLQPNRETIDSIKRLADEKEKQKSVNGGKKASDQKSREKNKQASENKKSVDKKKQTPDNKKKTPDKKKQSAADNKKKSSDKKTETKKTSKKKS